MCAIDRHHFDNPVYCYPGGTGVGGAAAIGGSSVTMVGGLMNNARIRNDLSNKNNLSNFERAKLGACALGGDDDSSEG